MRASCAQLLRSVLGAPLAVEMLEALGLCETHGTGLLLLFAFLALLLLPLSFLLGVSAPSLSLSALVLSCSLLWRLLAPLLLAPLTAVAPVELTKH